LKNVAFRDKLTVEQLHHKLLFEVKMLNIRFLKVYRVSLFMALLLAFSANSSPALAWQFYTGENISEINAGIVVLEPDNWSRDQLLQLKAQGRRTLAWLNLTQIEEHRIVPVDIRDRDYILSGRYRPENMKIAVFYHQSFRRLVQTRMREYLLKGFSGIVLAKTGYYNLISNSPINRSEMWRLITFLADDAIKINPAAEIIIHNSEDFWPEIKTTPAISGVLAEGLFFSPQGRQVRLWQRQKRLDTLKDLLEAGKRVMIAEDARTEKRRQQVKTEAAKLNLLAEFVTLPLTINERKP